MEDPDVDDFYDVEALLSEHVPQASTLAEMSFDETEAAEVLAVSWKEKRQELAKLQKARKFSAAKDVRRSFRVEIEELKRKTKCHRCGKLGHWSRECRSKTDIRSGKPSNSASPSTTTGAGLVQSAHEFVAFVGTQKTLVQRALEMFRSDKVEAPTSTTVQQEVLLVSSPGHGVIDSGCGRTIIGAETLEMFRTMWQQKGISIPELQNEVNHFKYGNGNCETTDKVAHIPVHLAGRRGMISAAVIKGRAPLLISRAALQTLKATVDFGKRIIHLFEDQRAMPLECNAAGQLVIPLLLSADESFAEKFQEILVSTATTNDHAEQTDEEDCTVPGSEVHRADYPDVPHVVEESDSPPDKPHDSPPKIKGNLKWVREDWGIQNAPVSTASGPAWPHVTHRRVRCGETNKILFHEAIDSNRAKKHYHHVIPKEVCHVVTEFWHDQEGFIQEALPVEFTSHQVRQLQKQARKVPSVPTTKSKILVIEVFSPPRFKPICEEAGFQARSIDLITGQDLTKKCNRDELEAQIRQDPPDLLVLCPPCTDEGGWFHLNSTKWDQLVYRQRVARSRSFLRFCAKLFQLQADSGRQAIFEHPTGAKTWKYPEIRSLCQRYYTVKCHMRQYGLKLPESENYIRKSRRLLVTHEEMKSLERLCPGKKDPQHRCHDVVAGHSPTVGRVSVFAGQYTAEFVRAVLRTVPSYANVVGDQEVLNVIEDCISEASWNEVLAARHVLQESKSDEELKPVLLRLHRNLGHPTSGDLIRILRHGQASEQALRLAKELECPFCQSHSKPHAALPAHPAHITEFNQQIGIDVKHLPGWRANQKVLALNIVDTASGFQRVIPFFETETSRVLWQLLKDHWFAWAGPPHEIILDPKATNLGEALVVPLEQQGIHVRQIAAEAHYQLGKVESHGGWFERVLKKVLDEHTPQNRDEWMECVCQTHVKNAMIQNHGVTPHQFVFGRNPHVPSDLLNEPQSVVAATVSTTDAALAKCEAIRTSARHAVIQLQDSRAMRVALLARPRVATHYEPGSLVAYWRCQKWIQGRLVQGGQWYGTAVVLGHVGRNLVLAHRKQILRAAPEQLRPATSEEKQLLNTSGAELLGIKDLIEGGAFKSQQYVDLTSQSYPSEQPQSPPRASSEDVPMEASQDHVSRVTQQQSTQPEQPAVGNMPPLVSPEVVPPNDNPDSDMPSSSARNLPSAAETNATPEAVEQSAKSEPASDYGPIRRKVTGKNGPGALWRPPTLRQEDFVSIMKEVVPRLIEDIVPPSGTASSSKRALESAVDDQTSEPATARQRTVSPIREGETDGTVPSSGESHEVLSVECLDSTSMTCEALIAEYLKKKMEKELPHSRNPPALQSMVDQGKRTEWSSLISKENVVKLHYGKAAARIKKDFAHRFIGSRFVLTRKPLEEGGHVDPQDYKSFTVKGRWCLQGHLDPDLNEKALTGKLQSPTLNQMSRMCLMQVIASHGWDLQLGDIKGAFLESGMIEEKYRPLYAAMPPGGIPGVDPEAVIEVLGNVYGQNDAPSAWFSTFDAAAQSFGWKPSKFDQCLYTLRSDGRLVGIMGVHVDDTALVARTIACTVPKFFILSCLQISRLKRAKLVPERQHISPGFPAMFSKLSSEESKVLKQLLEKAGFQVTKNDAPTTPNQDLLTGLFEGMIGDEEFEYVPMTDTSKRRLTAADPSTEGYGKTELKKKSDHGMASASPNVHTLPPGVTDLEMWGRTIMEKGKFASRQYAYEEMRASTEQTVSSYVEWLQNHLNDHMNAQFHDFVSYVKAKDFEMSKGSSSGSMIPGSTQTRKLK
eukprot:s52_g7.t1